MDHHHKEHPARPEQTEHGWEEGFESTDTPESEREGRFSRGQEEHGETPKKESHKRFSEGQEEEPREKPEKKAERRFSEGQEKGAG
jgi:hypothetical protein